MRILLFSSAAPGDDTAEGVLLDQLVGALPADSWVFFLVSVPGAGAKPPTRLDPAAVQWIDGPEERGLRDIHPFALFPHIRGAVQGLWHRHIVGPRIRRQAAAFGRRQGVDAVLAVLKGQTVINSAAALAESLDKPLYSLTPSGLVREPTGWWARPNDLDPLTSRVTADHLKAAIQASRAIGAASRAQAKTYARLHGVRALPMVRSHEARLARRPESSPIGAGNLVIGMTGPVCAQDETRLLVKALNACDWTLRGRSVRLRYFGDTFPAFDIPEGHLQVTGGLTLEALIDALSQCDLLYCPHPFDPDVQDVARPSFSPELVLYLAAGRAVVLHGPADCAPALYVRDMGAGVVADGLNAASIYNGIDRLVRDPRLYSRATLAAQAAFSADFTLDRLGRALCDLLDMPRTLPAERPSLPIEARSDQGVAAATPPLAGPGRPGRLWLALETLRLGPTASLKALRAWTSPGRRRVDLRRGWATRKHGVTERDDGAGFSSGRTSWDYVAALDLGPDPPGRYLSANMTCLRETVFVLLVDADYNQVGTRIVAPPGRRWFALGFDLAKTPTARFLIFQAAEHPKEAEITLHRLTLSGNRKPRPRRRES